MDVQRQLDADVQVTVATVVDENIAIVDLPPDGASPKKGHP